MKFCKILVFYVGSNLSRNFSHCLIKSELISELSEFSTTEGGIEVSISCKPSLFGNYLRRNLWDDGTWLFKWLGDQSFSALPLILRNFVPCSALTECVGLSAVLADCSLITTKYNLSP